MYPLFLANGSVHLLDCDAANLFNVTQGMVARTELLAALSDAKAKQDEIQAKANDLAWLERQLSKAQEQTDSARQETAQLRAEMSRMVRRSDLDSAKQLVSNLEAAVAVASQRHRETIAALNLRIGSLELEKSHCDTIMKVTETFLEQSLSFCL
jgi:hypothetical protein